MEGVPNMPRLSGAANAEFYLPNYRLGKTLGVGSFGKVKVAEHVLTGLKVAIKILNRRKIKSMDMEEKVRREIKILRLFMHPHIIRLYEVIETPADIFVVMEYVKGGELFDYIVEKGRLMEDEARRFFQQIVSGVEYCHRNMVVHRDLKPENLLLDTKGNMKIADFGLSNVMRDGHFLKTSCGSPNYAAPEVISGRLYGGPEVDVWSCGVILYALLCGSLPFDDENIPNLFKKIKGGVYSLPSFLSTGARDLVPRMLLVDPMKRITIPEIRQHPWFLAKLPRYLAVPPPYAAEQAKRIDSEILTVVAKMGFDEDYLAESLRNRKCNKATVAYYLMLDNHRRVSTGYLGAEFSEHKEQHSRGSPSSSGSALAKALGAATGSGSGHALVAKRSLGGGGSSGGFPGSPMHNQHRMLADRKWALGLQSRAHPMEVLGEVCRALQALDVTWKRVAPYVTKCRWEAPLPPPAPPLPSPLPPLHFPGSVPDRVGMVPSLGGPVPALGVPARAGEMAGGDVSGVGVVGLPVVPGLGMTGNSLVGVSVMGGEGGLRPGGRRSDRARNRRILRFEMQLFKIRDEKYLLDVQHVDGSHLLFLDIMAAFLAELHVI
ncbi:hypothetical protein CLOM_g7914 [Closterium sp. NIES-68]|nr:hypothetical protein CLOM_g7914 [Closterium sp. NIES-68]GJP58250.1 hypothetical protein CLOP_g22716 [Closterium sp. NIES-67]